MSGQRISQVEFTFMMAMLVASVALAIDAMLPALPQIAEAVSPTNPNRAQLIVTSFIFGMGVGTLFAGPLSDRFGRKPVVMVGGAIYVAAALLAWRAETLETMLAARVLQGLGAAAPRIVVVAIVRDIYAGREMARLMSFIMIIFTLVPAFAPSVGAVLIAIAGWRSVFLMFVAFGVIAIAWMYLRLREPLPPARRRALSATVLIAGIKEVLSHNSVRTSIGAQALAFGMLFSLLSSTQPVFDITFGRADTFHLWFGFIALMAGSAGFLNSALVLRLGMRFLITVSLAVAAAISGVVLVLFLSGLNNETLFFVFVFWQVTIFFQTGMVVGNLNALAMEPLGHMAGLAASVIGAISTVLSVLLAIPVGLAFDGTPVPVITGGLTFGILAVLLMLHLRRLELRSGQRA